MNIFNQPIIFMLMEAIAIIESGDDPNKVGKCGEIGVMQIRQIYIDDINRIYKTSYTLSQALDPDYAKIFFYLYTKYWSSKMQVIEGRSPTLEDIARIHNGGWDGYREKCTEAYWGKVQLVLEGLSADQDE